MKILAQDRRVDRGGTHRTNRKRLNKLIWDKHKETFQPNALSFILAQDDIGLLYQYATQHPEDSLRILINIETRKQFTAFPSNTEIVVWNSKPLKRQSKIAFLLSIANVPKNIAKVITEGNVVIKKVASILLSSKCSNTVCGEFGVWRSTLAIEGTPTLLFIQEHKTHKNYTTQADISADQLHDLIYSGIDTDGQTVRQIVAFDIETTGLDFHKDTLVGISFSWEKDEAVWIPCPNGVMPDYALIVLESSSVDLVAHNAKFDCGFLKVKGYQIDSISDDTQVQAYMLGYPKVGLKTLAETELGETTISFDSVVDLKSGQTFADIPLEQQVPYACQDSDFTRQLVMRFRKEMDKPENRDLKSLYYNVDLPLTQVLADMEAIGAPVNLDKVRDLISELEDEVASTEERMFKEAGEEFNPNSPQEVSVLLFTKLGLEPVAENATGYSTDKFVLRTLSGQHPVVPLLINYKSNMKLLQTYLRPLLAKGQTRTYANFNQTVTRTGRLSSSNPNLQNQPPSVRKVYEAEEGHMLIAADYAQQELRLLAHFSQEPKWLEAFQNGVDLHQQTADMFGIPRPIAKVVNFGIAYGAGPDTIAQQAECSKSMAVDALKEHKKGFPVLWKWIELAKSHARDAEQATSMFGRIRRLPNLNSPFPDLRNAAEREAVNMIIQGTAADITKMAMLKLAKPYVFNKVNDARIILQVHDEIIFEINTENTKLISYATTTIERGMESVAYKQLTVPMVATVLVGKTWAELKG